MTIASTALAEETVVLPDSLQIEILELEAAGKIDEADSLKTTYTAQAKLKQRQDAAQAKLDAKVYNDLVKMIKDPSINIDEALDIFEEYLTTVDSSYEATLATKLAERWNFSGEHTTIDDLTASNNERKLMAKMANIAAKRDKSALAAIEIQNVEIAVLKAKVAVLEATAAVHDERLDDVESDRDALLAFAAQCKIDDDPRDESEDRLRQLQREHAK